jgi:glycosyltransferase involved in cell wall biosynthesis
MNATAKTQPTVAVIIPTYNRAALLIEALESVLAQTFKDFEVFIVDDGSTDDTAARVAPYLADTRIHYVVQENSGATTARNYGIRETSCAYIAFLDSDDVWMPSKLEKQISRLKTDPKVGLVYSDIMWIQFDGKPLRQQPIKAPRRFDNYYEDLLYENVIYGSNSAVVLRASLLEGAELYDPELPALDDQDFWLRLSAVCDIAYVDEMLVKLRAHPSNQQSDPDRMAQGRMLFLEKLKRTLPSEYRHHLPEVEYVLYRRIVFSYLLKRRYDTATRYLLRMVIVRPSNTIRFIRDALARLGRVSTANWQ